MIALHVLGVQALVRMARLRPKDTLLQALADKLEPRQYERYLEREDKSEEDKDKAHKVVRAPKQGGRGI